MRIVVFGSTGGTGKQLIERGLARGHQLVAVARRPEAVPPRDGLTVVKGDVLDAASVTAALKGADAVISAFGPPDEQNPGTLMSTGVANLIAGCAAAGVKRLVFESGLMAGEGAGLSFLHRTMVALYGMTRRALRDDKRVAEASIRASPLDWAIVRPPGLRDGPATGSFVCGVDARVNPVKAMSFPDVADCLLDVTANAALSRVTLSAGH